MSLMTYLPYTTFTESAEVLDDRRLSQQRRDILIILGQLDSGVADYSEEPAVHLWRHHRDALAFYGIITCREWVRRGHHDDIMLKIRRLMDEAGPPPSAIGYPLWIGRPGFHRSHQSNLVRMSPKRYRKYFPQVSRELDYEWPN